MQLTVSRTRFVFAWVLLLTTCFAHVARAAGEEENTGDQVAARKEDKAQQAAAEGKAPEDITTKRISMETAAYTDSDHVTVFTPSIAASLDSISRRRPSTWARIRA